MKVRRSRLEVLGILDYVDLHGVDAASERFGVDGRTLKRWAEREPSGWQREEEVNRLLMIEKRIAGKVNYRDAVVGAGIATDKLWRQADRDARDARREGEPEPDRTIEQQRLALWDEVFLWSALSEDATEYLRDARRALVDYIDGKDDGYEHPPTEGELAAVRLGIDVWMRRSADTGSEPSLLGLRHELRPDADTLTIEQYRSLLDELRANVERIATGYAKRRIAGHVVTRHTELGRHMFKIVDERGRSVLHASFLPEVYNEHAILIDGPEPRLGSAELVPEPPPPPLEPARPRLSPSRPTPMAIDVGGRDGSADGPTCALAGCPGPKG